MTEIKRYFPLTALPKVLLGHAGSFLCWLDMRSFRLAFKSEMRQPDFKQIVRKRLEERQVDVNRFFNAMPNYDAMISGSFLLECTAFGSRISLEMRRN